MESGTALNDFDTILVGSSAYNLIHQIRKDFIESGDMNLKQFIPPLALH